MRYVAVPVIVAAVYILFCKLSGKEIKLGFLLGALVGHVMAQILIAGFEAILRWCPGG